LDSPLRGLEADPDAPADAIRGATRQALINLVDYAIAQRVDFVVAAGDLYDGDWQDWRTGQFLIGQIARLANAGIPLIGIRGNHDAESVITRRLRMPSESARWLDHRRPETYRLPGLPVSIHGQSFATRAVIDNIALAYPSPDPGRFNIGLLHSSVGERELHDNYAPCSVAQLSGHGYDYWALGHVHAREVLARDPWIVFPGNLQGRHINETGTKGAMLVTVTDGLVADDPLFVPFDTVRWARIDVDLAEDAGEDAALSQVRAELVSAYEQAEGRLLAARILMSGACVAHEAFSSDLGAAREKIRAEALSIAGPGVIWIERIDFATTRAGSRESMENRQDAIGALVRALQAANGGDIADDVRAYAKAMLDKAGPLRQAIGPEHVALSEDVGDLTHRARDLLLGMLDE
jgi:exonuclease SbcD